MVPLPLCQCHGKSEALIFVLDCSSQDFYNWKLSRHLCSHQLGREEGRGRRLNQQLEEELGTSLDLHDPFSLSNIYTQAVHPPAACTSVPGPPGAEMGPVLPGLFFLSKLASLALG